MQDVKNELTKVIKLAMFILTIETKNNKIYPII